MANNCIFDSFNFNLAEYLYILDLVHNNSVVVGVGSIINLSHDQVVAQIVIKVHKEVFLTAVRYCFGFFFLRGKKLSAYNIMYIVFHLPGD